MSAVLSQEQQKPSSSLAAVPKAVWAVLGALALATAGLAGALVTRATNPPAQPAVAAAPLAAPVTPAPQETVAKAIPQAPADMPEAGPAPKPQPKPVHKPAPAKVQQASGSAQQSHAPVPQPAPQGMQVAQGAGPAPAPAPVVVQAPVCQTCGTVQSVTEVKQKAQQGSGVGAAGGAVLGGLLGNQVGHGNGRAAMTVLGAVGGGFAGNEIEKHVRTTTVYDVSVRMEDGSYRTIRQASPVSVGTPVVVEGNQLRVGGGGGASAPAQPAVIRTNG
ncbi:glycine zipper 2TM domain-containing protein [Ramlibacter humi]|nr:glycine zipper 2TM domain-containing protein [Ramlibacter humi]